VTVTNFGTITGTGGVSVQFGESSDRLVAEAGSRLTGVAQGGGGTLELAKAIGTIAGSVGGGSVSGAETFSFSGFNTLAIDASGTWTLVSTLSVGAVKNAGVIENITGGTAVVQGAVTGSGSAVVNSGTLEFASTFSENVSFSGGTGVLELAHAQAYGKSISGFSKTGGTKLDLLDIAFGSGTKATFSGGATSGVLTVTDGTHTAKLKLVGDYTSSAFTVATDHHGGVLVTDPTRTSALAFASRMSAMGSAASGLLRLFAPRA
jgi:hypothetical protein